MSSDLDTRLATVRSWYAAYDARDIAALLALVHPEVQVLPTRPLLSRLRAATFHGHDGLRYMVEWTYETHPRVRVESISLRPVPRGVLSAAAFVIDTRETPPIRSKHWTLFHFDGARIRRVQTFETESEALEAADKAALLTAREREVFQMLAHGRTAPEIANELFLSAATVRTHVQNGMARLGAKTRIQAVTIAIAHGEITPG
jgi:DNA-binding CsgD family transcriptional regulator